MYKIISGWYSAGAFILAKTIADLIWLTLFLAVFTWVINYYGLRMYIIYYMMWTLAILCIQSQAQIIAMLFPKNLGMALGVCVAVQTFFIVLSNSFYPTRELHYSLQILSEFSHIRMVWECIIISIYDVCDSNEFSTVLYAYDLNGDQFWPNVIRLVIIALFWKFISIFVYCLKTGPNSMMNKNRSTKNVYYARSTNNSLSAERNSEMPNTII